MTQKHGSDTNKKQPETWIDNLPDPLETEADVNDLFDRVAKLKAEREAKEAKDKK